MESRVTTHANGSIQSHRIANPHPHGRLALNPDPLRYRRVRREFGTEVAGLGRCWFPNQPLVRHRRRLQGLGLPIRSGQLSLRCRNGRADHRAGLHVLAPDCGLSPCQARAILARLHPHHFACRNCVRPGDPVQSSIRSPEASTSQRPSCRTKSTFTSMGKLVSSPIKTTRARSPSTLLVFTRMRSGYSCPPTTASAP